MYVTIPGNSNYVDLSVTPRYDTLYEGGETVVVTLLGNSFYTVGSPNVAAVTINDPLPIVTVSASDAKATEPSTNTTVADEGSFTFTRTGSVSSALTVYYSVSGTATSGTDYDSIGTSLTIPAGYTSITKNIIPRYDTLAEGNETVVVTLSSNSAYATGSPNTATVTINDPPPIITVAASDATAIEPSTDEGTGVEGSFTFTRTGSVSSDLTVYYTVGGTATSGTDYDSIGTSLTIPAGSASATKNVVPKYDTQEEGKETVVVTLSSNSSDSKYDYLYPTLPGMPVETVVVVAKYDTQTKDNETLVRSPSTNSDYEIGSQNTATVTINDPLPIITVAASDATAIEPSTAADTANKGTFTFTRTGSVSSDLTVYYSVGGTAKSGTDYNSIGTSLIIPAGSTSATKNVIPKYDTQVEGNKTVNVKLTANEMYTIGTSKTVNVTIKDVPPVITAKVNPFDGGTATGSYDAKTGQAYTLTATPATGYQFVNWTDANGSIVSTDNPYKFSVSGSTTYIANFNHNANANPPDWTTPSHLANSMTIDAVVTQTDGSGIDADGSMLAFFDKGGNCRGSAVIRNTAFGTKVYSLQVWSDAATESGLTAKVWNAATGEVMDINGTFDFVQDTAMGSATAPVILKVGLATVVWTLNSGWNWVATNVTPQNADIAELLAGYTASDGDQIKTKDGYSTYYANYKLWDPTLSIVPGRMYAFKRKAGGSATVEISGAPLAADNTLPLVAGWNWIGCFTDAESIAVSSLVSTGGFSNNDQLKGRGSAYTTYYKNNNFSAWDGTLNAMTAGNGYKLYVVKAGTLSAIAAEQIRSGASCWTEEMRGGGNCPWTTPDSYANSMTLDAVVKLDAGTYLEADGSAIGVFDRNGNCRGVASIRTTAWGAVIYSGQVWSNAASEKGFTLKLWNGSTKEIDELNETIDFTQDTAFGSAMAPATFTAVPQMPEWEYSLDDNGNASITAYNGKAKDLAIPTMLEGHPVTAIAAGAFGANETLTSVTLSILVNLPTENVFAGCKKLTSVNYTLHGVQTDFGQKISVNIDGASTKETSVTLNPGWNLIAFPRGEFLPESREVLDGLNPAFYYDNTSKYYLKASAIDFNVPYWIFTKEELVIKIRTK